MKRIHVALALAAFLWVGSAGFVAGQNSAEIVRSTSNGVLWFGGNEVRSDAKDLDAAAVRIGSPVVAGRHGGGGKIGFDGFWNLPTNPTDADIQRARRVEAVGMGGSFNGRTGELGIWIWNGRDPNDIRDADQIKAIEVRADEIEFKLPVKGLRAVVAGATDRMVSLDGRFVTVQQGDGNFVTYDTQCAGGLGDPAAAVWSAWSGRTENCR